MEITVLEESRTNVPSETTRPRLQIGTWPTRVRLLPRVSEHADVEVWIKAEEDCGAWGGNKVRKLEYILGIALRDGIEILVSFGAGTSNWTAALAHHADAHGLRTVVGLAGPIPPDYARLYERTRTKVVASKHPNALPFVSVMARARAGRNRRVMPLGGTGPGDIGSLNAGLEIADQVGDGSMPAPTAVYVAAGTSGTAAGVAAGMALRGLGAPVVAVKAAPWPYGSARRAERHARDLLAESGKQSLLLGDDRFYKPGYARPNPASQAAIEVAARDGIELDPTYAAKAFAALLADARANREGPLLFIHTSPGPPP